METQTFENQPSSATSVKKQEAYCPELQAIQKVIDFYTEGLINHDAVTLKKAFHPQCAFFGWNGLAETLYETNIQALIDFVANTPTPSENERALSAVITSIRTNGRAAAVEVAMDNYMGCNYIDYFHLLKIDDRWWIVSKTFHGDPMA